MGAQKKLSRPCRWQLRALILQIFLCAGFSGPSRAPQSPCGLAWRPNTIQLSDPGEARGRKQHRHARQRQEGFMSSRSYSQPYLSVEVDFQGKISSARGGRSAAARYVSIMFQTGKSENWAVNGRFSAV